MSAHYTVEMDQTGCATCGHDRTWTVIGPDGTAYHTSWTDVDEAETLARDLNEAFEAGIAEQRRRDRQEAQAMSANGERG